MWLTLGESEQTHQWRKMKRGRSPAARNAGNIRNRSGSSSSSRSTSRKPFTSSTTTRGPTKETDDTITTGDDTTTGISTTGIPSTPSTTVAGPTTGTTTSKRTTAGTNAGGASPQTDTAVAAGVVGGLVGGVAITVVLVLLWRLILSRKRHRDRLDKGGTGGMGLIHANSSNSNVSPGGNLMPPSVPDVIMVSPGQHAPGMAEAVYDVIQEAENYKDDGPSLQPGRLHRNPQHTERQYTPDRECLVVEKDDHTSGDDNRLRDATTTDVKDTYNRLGAIEPDSDDTKTTGNKGTTAEYFVLEKSEDAYNKLGGDPIKSSTYEKNAYHRLGETVADTITSDTPDSRTPSSDYFVLERLDDADTKLGEKTSAGHAYTRFDVA
ncbi:uncharacterized protein LOC124118203 [Haliotis rufescens]|uniref:uncharacterized protein LOC124118203 n=1 Tax=Haliotis rufescens TaxID=6454 RepID=UPI001EB0272E|nr:uncharacterized protein LOC124118203 [Haliotis rufescens]